MGAKRGRTRALVMVVAVSLLTTIGAVVAPTTALAAGTVLFDNPFKNNTVNGTGTVTKPTPASGTNVACLSAPGNSATLPLLSCVGSADTQGSGKLRLTNSTTSQVGGVFGQNSFPTSNGLDVTFNSYQWGGGSADGIAFMLAAVDPANPAAPTTMGPSGGSLGYSPAGSVKGLTNAYLGVGLDVFGNFSGTGFQGTGCTNVPNITGRVPGAVVVRGPGNGLVGYCGLTTTYTGAPASTATLRAPTRAASVVPVQVLINPTASSFTSDSGVSVAAGTYKVIVTPVGQTTKTLTGTLPSVSSSLYPSTSWLSTNGVPKQLAFGFVGSTGSVTDVHEISDVKALTFNPVPQLAVVTTSYAAPTSQPGDPVTYSAVASVLAGANETVPISVTQTVPTGVVPLAAYGTGWVCQSPVGKTITCTTSASSFPQGTVLPAITVVAIVTGASVGSATIQTSSATTASSADANPGSDSAMTVGTRPPAPTGVTVNPTIGPIAGGSMVTANGNSTEAPTAIEIGTTAEQQAGTPVVLLPCPGAAAPGCFTISGSSVVISSMPARASAAQVTVTFVLRGIAGATSYVYADKPATPATPTVTAGATSATVSWVPPASNGSVLTGYVVTPYLGGLAQTPQSFDDAVTTGTFTGLTAGGVYAFTVAAVNFYGTSTASAKSGTVVPYTLPGGVTITAATAGTSAATLTWSNPFTGFTPIISFAVTPYIGLVAQPTRTFAGSATTQTVTALTPGTAYTFTVAAQNLAGTGPTSAKSSSVIPNVSPSLTFAAPPAGEVGVAYSQLLTVTDGTSPFVWSVSSGTLPSGLTLNASSGMLSGTPTSSGSFTFTVQVVDASSQSATKAVTLVVAAAPTLTFTPPDGEVGVPYTNQPTLTGGTSPFTWAITAGSLPAGVTFSSSSGLLSGTPTASGTFSLTIAATGALGHVVNRTATLVIAALPVFSATPPPAGRVGIAYSTSLDVTGGTSPLTWSITTGSLPPGLTVNTSTGVLSGTPTTVGSTSFTASVVDANSKTDTKSVTLVIAAGPLVIVKTANVSSTVAGGTVAYTITITNTGSTAWAGATLSDPLTGVLDDAAFNADATATTGAVSYMAPTLGWTGNIAAGGVVTISYSVTVNNPDVGNKVLSNTVTSSTLGANCASGSADARCSATVAVAGLTIVKTADVTTLTPGDTAHFSIVVTNTGPVPYSGATVTDSLAGVLDDAAYNADGTATSGNVSYTSPSLTWTGNLAVAASVTITYSATVADPDTGNRSLTGTVVSASPGSPCPSGSPAAQCTATVPVLVPALSIATTPGVSTTTPGATVAYTMTLHNTGQTAYTATSVTLGMGGALDHATYDNDALASAGSTAFNSSTGALVWTGDLAIGAVVTVTASVTVGPPDAGERTLTTVATSSAPGSTCPAGSSNPACATSVQVLVPELTITKAADVSTTTPGSVVNYTVSVTNIGQTPYTSATFSDELSGVLDDAAYNTGATASVGTLTYAAPTLTWTGDLAIGATATINYSVTVNPPDTGDKVLINTVTSATPGNTCPEASSNSACTSSVSVLIPGLAITGAIAPATTTPGSVVQYTLTVVNTGQTAYTGLAVTLDLLGPYFLGALDDATYNNDATITRGELVTHPDGTVDWVLNLAPGASATGTISMTVNDPVTGNKSILITAVSDAPGSPCKSGSAAPSCNATAAVLVPGLTITKTANVSTVTPGGTVDYTISVVNNGQTTYPAASFTDDLTTVLTDATYGGDATANTGSLSYNAPVLSWTGTLAPGDTATIAYSVIVRDPDPGDKRMYNTVVSSAAGNNCKEGSADPRCTAGVNVLVPRLTIVKTADTPTTTPGAIVGFTVTATNSGATPFTGAAFADSLTGVLDDATYNAGATASAGAVSFAGATLSWTGDLAIGASATITYSVTVRAADVGNDLLTNAVTSPTSGNNCATGSGDARCTVTVPVARLVLSQDVSETTTTPGSVLRLSATFTNTGQVPYTGITIDFLGQDLVDDAIPNGDQTATSGSLVLGATSAQWTGSIPVAGVVNSSGTFTVPNPDPGNKIISTTFVSTAPGNNCPAGGSDSRCTASITVTVPGLTLTKTASTTATVPGGTVGYTITVQNSGQTPYAGATVTDTLIGILDDATYNANAVATTGTVGFAGSTLTWTGDLAVGATATITYSVTVHNPETGDKTMVNPVSSSDVGSTCPPASGNAACRSTVVVLTSALSIVKTANRSNATLGTTVTYTVSVMNSGQTSYAAAAFTDSLAGVADDATYNGDAAVLSGAGTVNYAGGVLSWSGALTPGSSATITYTVTINNPGTGDRSMTNTVASSSNGSNCASGAGDTRCTAVVAITNTVSLTFEKTSDVASTVAGGVVRYTVTVVNSSTSLIDPVEFTDPMAEILDDATYNADATVNSGVVAYTAPNLTWSGAVPAGGTITITYSVTVNSPVTGDQILSGTVTSASLPASNNCLVGSTGPRCTNTVTVAGLVIQQSYMETSTTPGSLVRLSATFTNTGQMPYTGVTISSPSADTVDDAIATGDQTATSGMLVLSATAITWTGNIPVQGVVTVTGTLTVKDPDPGNKLITGTLVSASPGNNCPAGGTDTRCTAQLPVLLPGLTITKTADTAVVVPGGTAAYTITVRNSGQAAHIGATLTDSLVGVLDDATFDANLDATIGSATFASPTLTWTGDLAVGETATITYRVTANSSATGDKTMVNRVSSTTAGSSCLPGSGAPACFSIVAVLTPALTIASTVSAATSVPGATVTYTLNVINSGQTAYPDADLSVSLSDVLDDATYGGGAAATTGTVEVTGQTLTWSGALSPGADTTITYTVTVDDPVTGDYRLDQTVTSANQGSTCPAAGSDPRCATSVPIATLRIVNAADVTTTKPTGVVRNSVTLINAGQVPYVGISVSDSLVGSLDDATYNGDAGATAGSLILVAGTGRITWTGDLAVGATVVVTGSLTVNNPDVGDKNLSTLVSTDAAASNCPTGGTDPNCATSVTVLIPALTIVKTANATTATPGAAVDYTITITNSGQTPYIAATITDPLDRGVLDDATYGDVTATSGAVSFTDSTLTWIGDLTVGQIAVISFSVMVDNPDLGDKSVVNEAISDELGSTCPTGGANPSCSSFVAVLIPALDIAVSADRTTTVPGATVGYTVTIANTGQTDYVGAIVTTALAGVLEDASYAGGATTTTGTVTYTAPNLSWTGNIAVNAAVTISYAVTVANPDAGNKLLSTSVTSPAPGSTCGSAAQCANTVTVLIPGLAVSTAADVATATPGDQVVFTITVSNTGETPYDGTVVSTALSDIVDDASYDGAVNASIGVATYTAPNLSWTGTLHVGDTATISYAVTVRSPDPGNKVLSTKVIAPATGSTCPADSTIPACTATVTVLVPALSIVSSVVPTSTTPGSVVYYSVSVHNIGQTTYTGLAVTLNLAGALDDATYNNDATITTGDLVTNPDGTVDWVLNLAPDASATGTISMTVNDPDTGDKSVLITAVSNAPGSQCHAGSPAPWCNAVAAVLVPALTITKTADTATVVAGSAVTYTITVSNSGETAYAPAAFTDSLAGVLDDASYADDAIASTGDVVDTNSTLAWTGALAVGATATITYSVTTLFPANGDRTLANTVLSSSPGDNCATGTDPRCASTVTVLVPAFDVSKAADTSQVVAGGTVHYTISATNTGQADYPVASVSDSLAGVLDDATYNADATATTGALGYAGGTLSWNGPLPREATVTISYSVAVDIAGTGDAVLTNRAVSASVGSTCNAGSMDSACVTSTTVAARSITLAGLTPSFTLAGLPNSTVSSDGAVTMTVTTNSPGGYQVTVQAATAWLTGATPGNAETIPIDRLRVRESGTALFSPLSAETALVVHQQAAASTPGGDAVSNDYQVQVPFVPSDTYSATMDYIASAQ